MLASLLRGIWKRWDPPVIGDPRPFDLDRYRSALESKDFALAAQLCRENLLRNPNDPFVHNNLGLALQWQGSVNDALKCYDRAAQLAPGLADPWYNAGLLHHLQKRMAHAEECYRKALEIDPNCAVAHREYSMLRLVQGDFSQAVWASFRQRRNCEGFVRTYVDCSAPWWQGESLAGKSILVHGEQGLGDEILFASCYPDLAASAQRCVIVCEPRLEKIFQRSFRAANVVGHHRTHDLQALCDGDIDYTVPSGDLPLYFRNGASAFPTRKAYLAADASEVERWRKVLSQIGAGLKVGISWRGGTPRTNQAGRSVDLEAWHPIFELPDVHLVSLQYGDVEEDLEEVRTLFGRDVHHWPDTIADYDDTAALVSALDLVVTVTTSLAHLSSALGQKTWILANAAPRWCYMASGSTSPWYPTARIFRQENFGDWDPVMALVSSALLAEIGLPVRRTE